MTILSVIALLIALVLAVYCYKLERIIIEQDEIIIELEVRNAKVNESLDYIIKSLKENN